MKPGACVPCKPSLLPVRLLLALSPTLSLSSLLLAAAVVDDHARRNVDLVADLELGLFEVGQLAGSVGLVCEAGKDASGEGGEGKPGTVSCGSSSWVQSRFKLTLRPLVDGRKHRCQG